ncbi:GGDEF domain-containing protein [Methylocella sp. CPCC 101449]|uniref:GGDEF domain-containing protein n=1 Tax=Methylocella sp. CPCC 101449 TaxID=2987531 RepID=UPI00288CEDD4|nr:GGDEF domain-containing protein [Methylocella sp. CPCC 101449]MDT2024601.1 GGDEF domain-containing protein [Methylocella sp. CPCC 101449]
MDGDDVHLMQNRASMLYGNALPSAIMSCVGGALLCIGYWSIASRPFLLGWFGTLIALCLARVALARRYRRRAPSHSELMTWIWMATLMVALSGFTWGVAGLVLVGAGSTEAALLYCCLVVGAILSVSGYVAWWPAHLAFHTPILLLTAAGFSLSGQPTHRLLAVACLCLCIACAVIGWRLSHVFSSIIEMSARNARMAAELEVQAKALERANTQLQSISDTDFLTGLRNRRKMMALLAEQRATHGIILFDIDHFKLFNDKFGHGAGDLCLQAVADAASVIVSTRGGVLGRHGGEEFLAILPEITETHLWMTAEELRSTIARLHECTEYSLPRPVTISLGLALVDAEVSLSRRLESADIQLYRAKEAGRNRTAMYSGQWHQEAFPQDDPMTKL